MNPAGDEMFEPIMRHSQQRRIELAQSISGRKKIYLDLNFWIKLREVALGSNLEKPWMILRHLLRRGVRKGLIVCPISSATFSELLKQPPTPERRIATALLIDSLSQGVSMVRQDHIKETEVCHTVRRALGHDIQHPITDLVWTKVAYALGEAFPISLGSLGIIPHKVQTEFFDLLWDQPLVDMAIAMGQTTNRSHVWKNLSDHANAKCVEYEHEITSYKRAFEIELNGAADCFAHSAREILSNRLLEKYGKKPSQTDYREFDRIGHWTIVNGMSDPVSRRIMRSIFIGSSVHAEFRWNKGRKYKPNDWFDFQHAVYAVGYCDALFTEGPLHHLLSQPQLQLSTVSDCRVSSSVEEAIALVRSLCAR